MPLTLDFTFFYNVVNRGGRVEMGERHGNGGTVVELGYIDTWNLTDISGVACSKAAYSWSLLGQIVVYL